MPVGFPDSPRGSDADATAARYFLLDMGKEKFGDCILCLVGGQTILIDGGHPGDFDGQSTSDSLPDQIGAILKAQAPYDIDLLVVTHAHLDHIGCLPKMVKEGVLHVRWALVADERLGWGKKIAGPDSDVLPDAPGAARVVAALREEPSSPWLKGLPTRGRTGVRHDDAGHGLTDDRRRAWCQPAPDPGHASGVRRSA